MIRGKSLLFLLFSITSSLVTAQQLSHQVLVPLAGLASDSRIAYSQTAGETAVEIVGCINYLFTQGFQQPGFKPAGEKLPPPGSGVNVYPNPASDFITVELFGENARAFKIEVIDITGTLVIIEKREFSGQYWCLDKLDLSKLHRGFYLVRILSNDGIFNRVFKIEKI